MKKLILISLFTPILSFSQSSKPAIKFINQARSYFYFEELKNDKNLSKKAEVWAKHIANVDSLELSTDEHGEALFRIKLTEGKNINNIFLDSAVGWLLEKDTPQYYQLLCSNCSKIGFGVAENHEYIYVVAKYDKLYE